MNVLDARQAAGGAVSSTPDRPATAVIHDTPAVRLVVFRIEPGQQVAPHTNEGTVLLTVLSGNGTIVGGTEVREAGPGTVVAYAPGELHGMRAGTEQFCLMATIIRPR